MNGTHDTVINQSFSRNLQNAVYKALNIRTSFAFNINICFFFYKKLERSNYFIPVKI